MSKNEKLHLGLEISLFKQLYLLSGDFSDQQMYLKTAISKENITFLVEKLFDESVKNVIDPFLPENIDFGIRKIKNNNKTTSSIEFAINTENFNLQIIKSDEGTLLHLKLDKTIGFTQMPLVGEYFGDDSGISAIELIYLKKDIKNSEVNLETIKQLNTNYQDNDVNSIEIYEGFNLALGYYSLGHYNQLYYPDKITKQATSGGKATTSNVEEKPKKSIVKITDFSPAIKDNAIHILVSGRLNLSVFNFQLIGLSVLIPFETFKDFKLPESLSKIRFDIKGLALSYTSTGLSIKGAFYKEITNTQEEYNGLVTFKMGKLEIIAIGSYIKTKEYASLFAFGYLGVSIPIHPAFNIKGLGLGFGLNRTFIMPNISEIATFPLIKIIKKGGLREEDTIQKIFADLNKYIAAQENSCVIMAGIKFDSFKMVETIAIAAVAFGHKLSINLLGLSVFSKQGIYHVELAFSLKADVNEGIFMARGELTKNSFVLFPQLKLTGGFAFGMWFKGAQAGDFVISIGGYHPKFNVPAHYPNDIPRLGFDFNIGVVNIYGKAYFALTPTCIMAGIEGKICCKTDGSIISTAVSLFYKADFIILWQPFYYEAEVAVEIYVKVKIEAILFSVNSEFYLSARLQLWGPELGGIASFKVLKYEIPVSFGELKNSKPVFGKDKFIDAYLSESEKILTYHIAQGITQKFKRRNTEIIVVNPKDFVLEINSKIPITNILGITTENIVNDIYPVYNGSAKLVNDLKVKLVIDDLVKDFTSFISSLILQSVPKAIWNNTNNDGDPLVNKNLLEVVCTGIRLEFSKTELKIDSIPVSLYDTARKEYSDTFETNTIKSVYKEKDIMKELTLIDDFDILKEEEFDVSDLTNEIDIYRYKSILCAYTIVEDGI